MGKLPSASIVVPLYNCASHVGELVDCLKAQDHAAFEAILVDDGSDDDTAQTARTVAQGDNRFLVVSLPRNAGPGTARNEGLARAHGEYVFFIDADDYASPSLLSAVLARADQAGRPDIVCFRMQAKGAADSALLEDFDQWSARGYSAVFDPRHHGGNLFDTFRNWPWDKAFNRAFLLTEGIAFPALHRTEDLAFTCAALAHAKRIALLDQVLYTYRTGSQASSTATRDAHPHDFFASCNELRRFLESRGLSDVYRRTYTSWVGLCCALNLVELRTDEAFASTFDLLAHGGLRQLDISSAAYASALLPRAARAMPPVERLHSIGNRAARLARTAAEELRGLKAPAAAQASTLGSGTEGAWRCTGAEEVWLRTGTKGARLHRDAEKMRMRTELQGFEVAGRYTAADVYAMLSAVEQNNLPAARAIRARQSALIEERTHAWYERKRMQEELQRQLSVRRAQYALEYGDMLGGLLCSATQPLHDWLRGKA